MYKWVDSLFNSEVKPLMPIVSYPGLKIIGKNMIDMTNSGKVQLQCISAISKRFPEMPAVLMSMDLSLEAEAFGAPVLFSDHEVPSVSDRLLFNSEEVENLEIPELTSKRISEYIHAAELAAKANFSKPVLAGTIGPFSLAGRLFDITEIMTEILIDPDHMHMLLDKCTTFILKYIKALKKAGVNGVLMAEPAAGLLSPDQCDEFSSKYVKMIVDEIQDENFIIILHNCGHTEELVESMINTGAKGFHFGNAVNMSVILPRIPLDRLAFGNIDPAGKIMSGNPVTITEEINLLKEKYSKYKNFVISSGCDIPLATPLENIDVFFKK